MRGFIGNTDQEWYTHLKALQDGGERLEDVNFWRPSPRPFRAIGWGEPFLFRLKAPHNAIGGFGFYELRQPAALPVWLAWETFGQANGVESLREFEARLGRLRQRNRIESEPRIACILLSQPVFFEPDEWVRLPDGWKRNTVTGEGYDLATGEGKRVWEDCLQRASTRRVPAIAADSRYGPAVSVRPRLGQAGFRIAVLEAYGRACAITTEHSLPVLEAAHIRPYASDGKHEVSNGLLLRTDIHRLFDHGYVTVTPEYRFQVSNRLRMDYANGRTYYALQDQPIYLPRAMEDRPSRESLAWHNREVFLG